jgi:hypothetical protein
MPVGISGPRLRGWRSGSAAALAGGTLVTVAATPPSAWAGPLGIGHSSVSDNAFPYIPLEISCLPSL